MTAGDVLLDTSAVLAWLRKEPGADVVDPVLPGSVMSAVNWAELATKLAQYGLPVERTLTRLQALGIRVVPFDAATAVTAGLLWEAGKAAGLSLGDRACLATALTREGPVTVFTADSAWADVDGVAASVKLIR
ncbi:type II toxin-antitoxin system VapC family toxin [Amycolatopsis thermophila]|uniref:PIN domain nuclease of toxin-antitoxin system n=1 Tax=Amycolatopsis thermophila TaxID=206084 RepID=A0ABU0F5Y0_9PSEU|nr:type II toxin-antitoxin system VapC family toxin [Amycolatopsis thermophila]MDQ0382999.1 PIN domain nuclease of toxin-antitoxin system [Amycolatopsis thermophila]